MPRLSVLLIRSALIYLALGFSFGMLMLFNKGVSIDARLWRLLPAHIEFLLIGWTAQLIMGVGFWILPRFARGPSRGSETSVWIAFVLINIGVWLAGVGAALDAPAIVPLLGRIAEAGGAIAYVAHIWRRVKPLGA